jgi:predicted negative regulator of RcsB-dependent stress response
MKKIKKRQLKEDELVSTFNKFVRIVKSRTKEIVGIAVFIVIIVLLFAGYKLIRAQNLSKESQIASQILKLRAELDSNSQNLAKLENMAGKGKYSRLAYILLATYWMEKGDLAKAQSSLEKMPEKPKDMLYYQAQDMLGQITAQNKNYDKAIAIYKKIEKENPKEYSLDVVLYHQAEALEKKGDKEAALALYKKIQAEFPQTYYGDDASQKVTKLETGK